LAELAQGLSDISSKKKQAISKKEAMALSADSI
jgi:hypothetical protein